MLGVNFAVGFIAGAAVVLLVWIYEDRKRSRATANRPAEQQGARHMICCNLMVNARRLVPDDNSFVSESGYVSLVCLPP
ncbi:MAG: hypothetical protein E5W51_01885, partial [Mesorhizobium sp.]